MGNVGAARRMVYYFSTSNAKLYLAELASLSDSPNAEFSVGRTAYAGKTKAASPQAETGKRAA